MVSLAEKTTFDTIPFALPDITEAEIEAVVRCIRSGWLTTGPNASAFEKAFTERMGGRVESVAVNSCTAALLLALDAMGIGEGDEVITTTYTFSASAMVIHHVGAKPVLVDIDPVTLNIDPAKVEAAITPRTKAIIPVHFAGLACDMAALYTIAKKHGLRIIEDAAHALPTTSGGRLIGAGDSDAVAFSFYATKTMTTGEGGMITLADPEVAAKCRTLRLHGINRDVFKRYTTVGASWFYEIVAAGHKCNLTDIAASIGLVQLARVDEMHQKRAAISAFYDEALAGLPIDLPPHAPDGDTHAWHLYVIKLRDDAPLSRDAFIEKMAEKGIGCSVHFIPLHKHPYWRDSLGVSDAGFPVASAQFERVVSLPIYTKLTDSQQHRIADTVRELLG